MKISTLSVFIICLFFSFIAQAQNLNVTASSTPSCTNNGTLSASVTGGTPPYNFIWTHIDNNPMPPQFTANAINMRPGTYRVNVTDAAGNTGVGYTFINSTFYAYVWTLPDTCNSGKGVAWSEGDTNNPPYSYLWSNGAVTDTLFNVSSGYYSVTVTDGSGCFTNSEDVDSLVPAINLFSVADFQVTFSNTNANCQNGTLTANITGGTGPFTYSWNTIPVQTTATAVNLNPYTNYTVTITDATGCSGIFDAGYVPSTSNISGGVSSIPDTCGSGVGSLTAYGTSGTPPYSFLWSSGQTSATISSLLGGNPYSVTITDAQGCKVFLNNSVINYSPITVTATSSNSSCSAPTGSITTTVSGGTTPYTFIWNSNPIQTTQDATSLPPGNYNVLVTDADGCSRSAGFSVGDNSNLAAAVNVVNAVCYGANGSASASVSGGTPPYSYSWNTVPVQTSVNASGLRYGNYTLTVTDAAGCIRRVNFYIGNTSPVNVTYTKTDASCIFIGDGLITANSTGGTPPYSYTWSNGSTSSFIFGLLPGYYGVIVEDANGCEARASVNIGYNSILPCASVIEGYVYGDITQDCQLSPGEYLLPGVKVKRVPDESYQFTNSSGYYKMYVPSTGNTQLDIYPPSWYSYNCQALPINVNIPALGISVQEDFAMEGNATDLLLFTSSPVPARPGFSFTQRIGYRNQGSFEAQNPEISVKYDPALTLLSTSIPPSFLNPGSGEVKFNLPLIPPASLMSYINLTYQVPANLGIGNQLIFYDSISFAGDDTVDYNNGYRLDETVVGSYDPNDIQSYPKGNGTPGYILTTDSIISYTVRFQNTGTYPAQNIVVNVNLDSDLDLNSFEYRGSSFPCDIEINSNGVATFTFTGIFLPDSNMNEELSHGYVSFALRQNPGLAGLTPITAQAGIIFDYNAPVMTNTVLNTITSVEAISAQQAGLLVYPNPATSELYIVFDPAIKATSYQILDVTGRIISSSEIQIASDGKLKADASGLNAGIYFIRLHGENFTVSTKFIKQ